MDHMKRSTITKMQYDEIAHIVDQAKSCGSLKEAQPYIKQLNFCASLLPDRCGAKAFEVAIFLQEYCKQNADKQSTWDSVASNLYVLNR